MLLLSLKIRGESSSLNTCTRWSHADTMRHETSNAQTLWKWKDNVTCVLFASLVEFNSYMWKWCGGKREAAPLHSLGKFQLCLDVPLALALYFASLGFCRNVTPYQPGVVCHCHLCALRFMCLCMGLCIRFRVLIKYFPQSFPKITNLHDFFFSSCLVIFFHCRFLCVWTKLNLVHPS